jgi:hypothetical protein
MKPVELDIRSIILDLPVRYDEDDMPMDFPHRDGDRWRIEVLIDSGEILNWPEGVEYDLYMKVVDGGTYTLNDANGEEVGAIYENYVPHGVVPGEYGDYVDLKIGGDGVIKNWPSEPSVEQFFSVPDDD